LIFQNVERFQRTKEKQPVNRRNIQLALQLGILTFGQKFKRMASFIGKDPLIKLEKQLLQP
jgi:hypothetical protein